jgi:hypothetical protein
VPAAGRIELLTTLVVAVVIAATAILVVLNPSLTVWLLGGIVAGSILRLIAKGLEHGQDSEPLRDSENERSFSLRAWMVTAPGLGLAAIAAAAGLYLSVNAVILPNAGPPHSVLVVPVTYEAQAALVASIGGNHRESFSLDEQASVSNAAIAAYAEERGKSARQAADELAALLARSGWVNPQLRTDTLQLERSDRLLPVEPIGWPPHATVTLAVPPELLNGELLVLEDGAVEVSAVKHAVLKTSPSSEAKELAAGRELREVALKSHDESVSVELAHPRLRNELGALVLGLSVGRFAKGGVLLVWGILLQQIGTALKAVFKRIFGRAEKPKRKPPKGTKRRPKRRRR